MGPSGRIGHILYILDCLGQVYADLYLGRAPRTKETLPDFLKWRRVTRPPLVFRGLTGSQRTPGFWGVTLGMRSSLLGRRWRNRCSQLRGLTPIWEAALRGSLSLTLYASPLLR